MTKKGNILKSSEYLQTNDYLLSAEGLYYAYMQNDGNLVIYRGNGPDDRHDVIWNSGKSDPNQGPDFYALMQEDGNLVIYKGTDPNHRKEDKAFWASGNFSDSEDKFFVILQDDGNLIIYRGTGPSDREGDVFWSSDKYDPVVNVEAITDIKFDVDKATKQLQQGVDVYCQEIDNPTNESVSQTLKFSRIVASESSWSNSLGESVTVTASWSGGVPDINEGKIEVSMNVTDTFEMSGSTQITNELDFEIPVVVPPQTNIVCDVTTTKYIINVPYTLKGVLVFKSGARMSGHFTGTYMGANETDFTTTYKETDVITKKEKAPHSKKTPPAVIKAI